MPSEEPRVGVYICHCGSNIAGVVNVDEVTKYAETLPNVVVAKNYVYMCSAPAQEMIKEDIKKENLNRVIVASCTPRMHEPTFRSVVESAGLNPYLFEMANIREHCSLVHSDEPERATKKAGDLIRMAVAKARLLKSLEKKEVGVTIRALIIGAGIAGLRAALDLAQRGFHVHLVEKAPTIGGRTAQLSNLTYTGKRASSALRSIMDEVASNDRITIHTNSEVTKVEGFIGNFKAMIMKRPCFVNENCTVCGRCEEVCPIEVPNDFEYGLTTRKAIYLPFSYAFPPPYVIDEKSCNKCGECVKACDVNAIELKEKPEEVEVDVGTIIVATGFDLYEPLEGEYGYKIHDNVITLQQLERFLDENGPTKGEITVGSEPKNIVFILCVGSRQIEGAGGGSNSEEAQRKLNTYCSRICCAPSLKNALLLKQKYPDSNLFVLYRDIRTYGRDEELYQKANEALVRFVQYKAEEPPIVSARDGHLKVDVYDVLANATLEVPADLVVLSAGVVPRKDASNMQEVLRIGRSADGFFQEAHIKLRPLETPTEGIYLAGFASGPKNMVESASSGSGAAAKAAIPLARGKVELEPTTALVVKENCDGCAFCVDPCVGKAITLIEYKEKGEIKKTVEVNEALCKGCGICQATCPKKGIVVRHFRHEQISAMIMAAISG